MIKYVKVDETEEYELMGVGMLERKHCYLIVHCHNVWLDHLNQHMAEKGYFDFVDLKVSFLLYLLKFSRQNRFGRPQKKYGTFSIKKNKKC